MSDDDDDYYCSGPDEEEIEYDDTSDPGTSAVISETSLLQLGSSVFKNEGIQSWSFSV